MVVVVVVVVVGRRKQVGGHRVWWAGGDQLMAPGAMHTRSHLLVLHGLRGDVVRGALGVVGHVRVARVQQLTQPKVCKVVCVRGGVWRP